jgi:hypothetical protein
MRPHLQSKQIKMDWRYGSSSREPALQVQSPEFKLESHKQTKRIEILFISQSQHHMMRQKLDFITKTLPDNPLTHYFINLQTD